MIVYVDNSTDMVSSSHDVSEDNDDVEVVRLSRQLDGWYRELKSNVLVSIHCINAIVYIIMRSIDIVEHYIN